MPLYKYKAVTKDGQIVFNKVEATNQYTLLRKLKLNRLLPIEVTQINTKIAQGKKKEKKNVESQNSVLKSIRKEEIEKNLRGKSNVATKIKRSILGYEKIKKKDIAVFTENLYLLKKANFNNIHALSTIINNTENENFKAILEDILLGVEAGDNMYATMEYYDTVFPPIYINMIKVGELSRSINKSIRTSS